MRSRDSNTVVFNRPKFKKVSPNNQPRLRLNHEQQTNHLLQIFPAEIWTMVLENISSNDDIVNISNAAQFFRQIYLPNRITFLFPKLWPVLRSRPDVEYGGQGKILNYRLVCSSWNQAIENFYQENPSRFQITTEQESTSKPAHSSHQLTANDDRYANVTFSNVVQVSSFYRKFSNDDFEIENPVNPFLGRSLHLKFPQTPAHLRYRDQLDIFQERQRDPNFESELDIIERRLLWLAIVEILESFGKFVWYFHVDVLYQDVHKVLQCLGHMPNLKTLSISTFNVNQANLQSVSNSVRSATRRFPPRKMNNLNFLSLQNVPINLVNNLVEANAHVTQFKVINTEAKTFDGTQLTSEKLTNLKKLCVSTMSPVFAEQLLNRCQNSRLEELHFIYQNICGDTSVNPKFEILVNLWSESLKHLVLKLPTHYDDLSYGLDSSLALNLPKLEYLKLTLEDQIDIGYFLPLKMSLKELHISFDTKQAEMACGMQYGQDMSCFEFINQIENFSVWNTFVNLQKIVLGGLPNFQSCLPAEACLERNYR